MNADTYRDSFLRLVAQGMTYREAMECFDPAELQAAVRQEMDRGDCRKHQYGQIIFEADEEPTTLFDLTVRAEFERRNSLDSNDGQQCLALWQAGWTSENANPTSAGFWGQPQLMSLYWRAPSKRAGKPGRRYLSTNQAYNALMRSQQPL